MNPTTEEIRQLTEYTHFAVDLANEVFGQKFPYPKIEFDLKGRVAGYAYYHKNKIRYNIGIFRNQPQKFLDRTTYHEVGHLISFKLYGEAGKGHGKFWKYVMQKIGQEPSRCHDYDVPQEALRVKRPYVYKCPCREFHLTRLIHNRILSDGDRKCPKCGSVITFVKVLDV